MASSIYSTKSLPRGVNQNENINENEKSITNWTLDFMSFYFRAFALHYWTLDKKGIRELGN